MRGQASAHGDVLDGCWRFRTKGNRSHRLRLPALALDQIGTGEAREPAFPGKRGTKVSGWSKLKRTLDQASG